MSLGTVAATFLIRCTVNARFPVNVKDFYWKAMSHITETDDKLDHLNIVYLKGGKLNHFSNLPRQSEDGASQSY